MLAFAWPWHGAMEEGTERLSERLGNSLCAGIGGEFGAADIGALHFAYRPLRPSRALSRGWRPARLPSGRLAAFHGYFDNAAAIAEELGCSPRDLSQLYGLAVDRWEDDADLRIVG